MKTLRCLGFALLFACAASMAGSMTVSDITPGKAVVGPSLTSKDFKGKVVLVLFWGTH